MNVKPTAARITSLNFASLAKSRNDLLSVPSGYSAKVVYRSGDPIASGVPAYSNLGTDVPARYERSAGDCHDGVEFFALSDGAAVPSAAGSGNQCGILAMKHEYITAQCLHPAGPTHSALGLRPANEVDREVAMHGVSVVEVWRQAGGNFVASGNWAVNAGSEAGSFSSVAEQRPKTRPI